MVKGITNRTVSFAYKTTCLFYDHIVFSTTMVGTVKTAEHLEWDVGLRLLALCISVIHVKTQIYTRYTLYIHPNTPLNTLYTPLYRWVFVYSPMTSLTRGRDVSLSCRWNVWGTSGWGCACSNWWKLSGGFLLNRLIGGKSKGTRITLSL